MQLIDVIELYLEMGNMNSALEYQIYLISLTQILIENGIDPRNAFNTILKTIQNVGQRSIDDEIFDYMLITMSQIIHNISPLYLRNALEIIKVLNKINFQSFVKIIFWMSKFYRFWLKGNPLQMP